MIVRNDKQYEDLLQGIEMHRRVYLNPTKNEQFLTRNYYYYFLLCNCTYFLVTFYSKATNMRRFAPLPAVCGAFDEQTTKKSLGNKMVNYWTVYTCYCPEVTKKSARLK